MKIELETPRIVRVSYYQEPGDPKFGSCLWAYFDFDLEKGLLNIQSNCGNAACRWYANPAESFLKMMARVDDDYLERKLFDKSEVDGDEARDCKDTENRA